MKKFVMILCASFMLLSSLICQTVSAEETAKTAYYADDIIEGEYNIEVTSSSSMFKIVECVLKVSDSKMTAVMTLSGTGYEKLFMGTGEEADKSSDENCIYFVEDEQGKYTYTVPVEALNKDIDCAAWSIRKQKWYDRVLVFEADSLSEDAFVNDGSNLFITMSIIAVLVILAAVVGVITSKKKKSKEN